MDDINQFLLPTENATAHAWAIEVGQYYILKGAAGREQAKSILHRNDVFSGVAQIHHLMVLTQKILWYCD
jgi:hypothetical protein